MTEQQKHPDCPPRLDRYFKSHPLFFVTFNTWKRTALLACDAAHDAFVHYCRRGVEMNKVVVGRYVLMPDHVHLFVRGDSRFDLGLWVRGLRRGIGKAIQRADPVWQPGFFDHVLRSDESYAEKAEYVRMNPVRAGLVILPDDWPFQGVITEIGRV